MDRRIRTNRASWDEMAAIHASGHSTYPVGRIRRRLKTGWGVLPPDDLGPVRGKSLLHLQCHIGTDSLMWARRGAKVTGADLSPRSILEARALSRASGISARFIESNVYDLPRVLGGRFDIVLTYYGVLCWLHDLRPWARVVARFLKPGGFFYVADGHPFAQTLEFDGPKGAARLAYPYFNQGAERFGAEGETGTYAAAGAARQRPVNYQWQHSLADVVGALRGAGLTIDFLHEFPYAFYDIAYHTGRKHFRRDRRGHYHLKGWEGKLPLLFSIKARR